MEGEINGGGRFGRPRYIVKRDIFRLAGGEFRIYDADTGEQVLYSRQKAFRLREDIRLYAGESMTEELFKISTPEVIDFGATYIVADSKTGETIGSLRRKGVKSFARDEWVMGSASGAEIGEIREDSLALALLRRTLGVAISILPYGEALLGLTIPQRFNGDVAGEPVCTFRQNFNPLALRITADFSYDEDGRLDRRLGLAAVILLCAVEGR